MRRDQWVCLILALPFFAAYLFAEGACEGMRWLSGQSLRAFQAIAGGE